MCIVIWWSNEFFCWFNFDFKLKFEQAVDIKWTYNTVGIPLIDLWSYSLGDFFHGIFLLKCLIKFESSRLAFWYMYTPLPNVLIELSEKKHWDFLYFESKCTIKCGIKIDWTCLLSLLFESCDCGWLLILHFGPSSVKNEHC